MSDPYANIDLRPIPIPENGWRIGTRTIRYYHNDQLICFGFEPIYATEDDPILDQIQIYHEERSYDDVPPPTQEELDRAIAIYDRYEFPDPEIPQVPEEFLKTSWD